MKCKQRGSAIIFECPACECLHSVYVAHPQEPINWKWNGSYASPTFHPSILVNGKAGFLNPALPRCHFFVVDGKIQYLSDCSHPYAGQTVDLPEMD